MARRPNTRHPSGLTLARWADPFKTPQERERVAAYHAKIDRQEKTAKNRARLEEISRLPYAPF